jgi:hypothetical protein
MKDLQVYVDKVWTTEDDLEKRNALRELVNASTASRKTKVLTLLQIDKMPYHKLDSLAINYSLRGEGLGVI